MRDLQQKPGRLKHFVQHVEEVSFSCFEVSTRTEDGHRLSGYGATVQQAIEDAHEKTQSYGDHEFPSHDKSLPLHGRGGDGS
jgi:hypothetical protein